MARAKTTRKLTGRALSRYFEGVLEAEPELGLSPRRRLLDLIDREVAQVRVRMSAPARRRQTAVKVPTALPEAAPESAPAARPDPGNGALPAVTAATSDPTTVATSNTPSTAPPAPAAAPFNPYQFSAVAVMTRGGPDALLARLAAITEPANLRKFASAQHIAVPADITSIEDLRRAIVDGAAQRIADRRAAAS